MKREEWIVDENNPNKVLTSGKELLFLIRNCLEDCLPLTRKETIFDLYKIFKEILRDYNHELISKLPK